MRFRLPPRRPAGGPADRAVWQAASLLLSYPDEHLPQRLDTVEALLVHAGPPAALLRRTASALRAADPMAAAAEYVETFDMRRRATMLLTYWTGGDTRNRGMQMLAFAHAYREAGVQPPAGEAPDYLPVVLEFAATVDPVAGGRLLLGHRAPIDVVHRALTQTGSRYAFTVGAVCQTLREATDQEVQQVRQLMESGPPAEAVGLQPFTAAVSLGMPTVPAR
ncbi:nitrate reductase molybdenum cofactor assembly chaperone [Mycolicibacter hiberniae]|uniref:Nitrate reductase molybdenum cofactor assembly chaperone n=1 Tax=Mycolicibacter hiberniae TaxID=29314 RepID=A0A7I7WZC9_9MYCO|nr:nitrate reductase molybdenum cofactor assembly chaperone [Mycolicibacter hiberniae]MCV7086670.1 nitrate reductase molybdenum cofactor assembly chaperone [Mycolicibacter hiberniae]ORV67014.1 nitrate reductase [Mycolicibacter hiberniae]BBZ22255.1 nitrate reductase molybdenum cofactor assembly chaperone [Mycolicibacter hiberniae]